MTDAEEKVTHVCKMCKGLGWTKRDVSWDHEDFGRMFRCVCNPAPGGEEEKAPKEDSRVEQWRNRADVDFQQEVIPF